MQECLTLIRRGVGDGVFTAGLAVAAGLASLLGDADEAITLLRESVLYGRDTGNRSGVGTAIDIAVLVFADQGRNDVAATLAGALEHLSSILPAELDQRTERVEHAHAVLGDAAFATAYERGTSMSYNDAVDYLLDQINSRAPSVGDG